MKLTTSIVSASKILYLSEKFVHNVSERTNFRSSNNIDCPGVVLSSRAPADKPDEPMSNLGAIMEEDRERRLRRRQGTMLVAFKALNPSLNSRICLQHSSANSALSIGT